MAYIVSFSNHMGVSSRVYETGKEAYETALQHINDGRTGVRVKDMNTDVVDDEMRIRQVVELVRKQNNTA